MKMLGVAAHRGAELPCKGINQTGARPRLPRPRGVLKIGVNSKAGVAAFVLREVEA